MRMDSAGLPVAPSGTACRRPLGRNSASSSSPLSAFSSAPGAPPAQPSWPGPPHHPWAGDSRPAHLHGVHIWSQKRLLLVYIFDPSLHSTSPSGSYSPASSL